MNSMPVWDIEWDLLLIETSNPRGRREAYRTKDSWAGEITEQFKALAALTEDLGSIPSNHMVARINL